jgi:ABC-2 type transport system permease protein
MTSIATELRKYAWVGITSARSNLAYLGELASRTVFLFIILFIFAQLWRITYAADGAAEIGGLTLSQMLWYLGMAEAFIMSTTNPAAEIDGDVRTGALAVQLIRPMSYPLYRLGVALGERSVRFSMNLILAIIIVTLLTGFIPFSLTGLLMFALSLPLAFVLDFLSDLMIGLCAFWLEDTNGLRLLYRRATMMLGGMMLPLTLFPDWAQPILKALPFASIIYGPAKLFVTPDASFFVEVIAKQAIFIVLYVGVVALIYRAGIQRISSNGG